MHVRSLAPSQILRKRRADRGALQLASPEVKFQLEKETSNPLEVSMYQVCVCVCVSE
jgi:exosome complex exonuclease DIS3/RRP44